MYTIAGNLLATCPSEWDYRPHERAPFNANAPASVRVQLSAERLARSNRVYGPP
jgi:hypothetical protein